MSNQPIQRAIFVLFAGGGKAYGYPGLAPQAPNTATTISMVAPPAWPRACQTAPPAQGEMLELDVASGEVFRDGSIVGKLTPTARNRVRQAAGLQAIQLPSRRTQIQRMKRARAIEAREANQKVASVHVSQPEPGMYTAVLRSSQEVRKVTGAAESPVAFWKQVEKTFRYGVRRVEVTFSPECYPAKAPKAPKEKRRRRAPYRNGGIEKSR